MAIQFDEVNDYYNVPDNASLTLPDSDWCVGVWTKLADNTGTLFQYPISSGAFGANNTFNLWIAEASASSNQNKWLFRVQDADGDFSDNVGTATPGGDNKWRLIIVQRRDADSEFQMWLCEFGQTSTKDATGAIGVIDAIDAGAWNLGRRADGNADRYYGGILAEFFKGDFSLTQEEITALGAGVNILSLGKTAASTLRDLIRSNDATRQDTPTTVEHAPVRLPIGATLVNVVPAVVGQPIQLRGTQVPGMRQWQPR
jgi:hypothetical protein